MGRLQRTIERLGLNRARPAAVGFVGAELAAILLVPTRADPTGETDPEPVWLMDRLMDSRAALKVSALLVMAGSLAGCLVLAVRA